MKKRIEIELLPKDFKETFFYHPSDCALARACKRKMKLAVLCDDFSVSTYGDTAKNYKIVDSFEIEDYDYVKAQYTKDPKALKAIYVVTLEEV